MNVDLETDSSFFIFDPLPFLLHYPSLCLRLLVVIVGLPYSL